MARAATGAARAVTSADALVHAPEPGGGDGTPGFVHLTIPPPNMLSAVYCLVSTAPYVSNNFSQEALDQMREQQKAGSRARSRRTRNPKDFERASDLSRHVSHDGWCGIPATAYRTAMIDACRMVGFKMTHAKCSIFIVEDGYDRVNDTPLVRIEGEPVYCEHPVRNDNGSCDLRARSMWKTWWVRLRVRWNADQFNATDVANLLLHAGISIGVGAGRPFSKNSAGMGWGTWTLDQEQSQPAMPDLPARVLGKKA